MIALAIDTAGPYCSVCIYDGSKNTAIASFSENIGRGHAEILPSAVQNVLEQAQLGFEDFDLLAVTEGPGSFAGIRVGIAYVRALALALDIKAIGVSSLKAMAQSSAVQSGAPAFAILDARRGEVYVAASDEAGKTILEPSVISIEQGGQLITDNSYYLCGNGIAQVLSEPLIEELSDKIVHHDPSPPIEMVAQIALESADIDATSSGPTPRYLRAADAKPSTNFALDRLGHG